MLKSCPDSVDVTDLQFKLQCRLKVFNNDDFATFLNTNSLLTCASRYGLLFVGTNAKQFQVIQTQNLQSYSPKDKEVVDYPRRNIELPSSPQHLCVNCDNTVIAVVVEKDHCPVVIFYDVLSFLSQNVKIIKEVRLSSTPNVYVRDINWNPSLPPIFTACKSDGTLGVYELKGDSVDINELPAVSGATCFCWSPKGKQIAVGSKDGKITQYKPDLKAVKVINEPNLGDPHSLINLQWVSNYQFIGIYQSITPEGVSCLIVIDAPKAGETSYTNYDDICYSGSSRPPQFYLILQQSWNFLMVASANSTEVCVLGANGDTWTQWVMADTGRAELPLSSNHQETFPVGLTFDVSSTSPLPWGESSLPPCPLLGILSHQGVLCIFNVVYLKEGIPSVCTPPDSVQDTSGLNHFITKSQIKHEIESTGAQVTQIKAAEPPLASKESVPKVPVPFTNLPQSTPLVTGKHETFSKNLFGGQATLTPIRPQQPNQGVPLFGGQTLITPISKGGSTPSVNPQVSQAASQKYASIFSSLNQTTIPSASTVPVKPIVITAAAPVQKPEASLKPQIPPTSKVSESTASKGNFSQIPTSKQDTQIIDPKLKAETNAMLSQMIKDEWMYLEAELKILVNQGRSLKISLGSEEEKTDMITQIESLQEFVKEAVDISVGQSSEIHCLKQNLIQSWAWFEEANSYYNSSKNEAVTLLLKLQPLDSVSQKRLKDIEQLTYYIESQLQQASKTLDEQWGNFQDYAKKTHRIQMPTMEAIFQTMVSQSAILKKQMYILKDISMRLKKKTYGVSSLLLSVDKMENLADDLKELRLDAQDILQLQYEKIKKHTKIMSSNKANRLRSLLKQREITHITAVKPQISSWTINQSPTSKIRQSISILGAQMSPVSKPSVVKNLNFVQSTPLKENEALKPSPVSQGATFTIKTTEKPIFASTSSASMTSSGFVSLAKSGPISSSQGSAFAPIGFAASESQLPFPKTSISTAPFSFGNAAPSASKTSTMESQMKVSTVPSTSNTSTSVTTAASGPSISFGGTTNSLFKSAPDSTTAKLQSVQSTLASPAFSFSFSSSAPPAKSVSDTFVSNQTSANNLFSAGSSTTATAFTTALKTNNSQIIKPTSASLNLTSNINVKSIQTPTTSSNFGSQQSSFASLSKSAASTAITTAPSTLTPPKSTSGVASIFANIQSVIDKATGTTGTTSTVETSKPSLSFGFSSGAVTTTTQSLFGSVPSSTSATKSVFGTSTAGGIFGSISSPKDNVSSTTSNLFNSAASSSFSTSLGKTEAVTVTSSSAGLFESSKIVESNKAPIATTTTATSEVSSIFGSKSTSSSLGTALSSGSLAATTNTSATPSVFGTNTSSLPKSGDGIFGAAAATSPVSSTGTTLFGVPQTATSTTSTLFGSTTQPSSLFGSVTTSANLSTTVSSTSTGSGSLFTLSSSGAFVSSNSSSIFGSKPTTSPATGSNLFATSTTSANIFGTPETGQSIFGAPSSTSSSGIQTTTTSSIFGAQASTNVFSSSGSIFGSSPPASTTNVIGASSPSSNVFGASTTTATTNIFGSTASAPASTASNIFASTGTASTASNIFGSTATASTASNIFGSTAPASTASNIFGSTTNTPSTFGSQSSSIFGTPKTSASVFGQPSAFGTQATTTSSSFGQPAFGFGTTASTTSGNVFGSQETSSSGFGSGFGATTSTFGTPATTSTGSFGFGSLSVGSPAGSGSIFGGAASGGFGSSPANPFGKVETKSPFGSSNTSIFGHSPSTSPNTNIFASPATTTSSLFGSGGANTFGSSTSSTGGAFGSPSTFGSSAFGQKPTFGQSSTFGSTTFGNSQSGVFGRVGTSPTARGGDGDLATFPNPSGFGSPPVFGGSPTPQFGSAPSFGGAPAFGSAPTFGSPEKIFGSPQAASGGFGAAASQPTAGFGNLASQNTIGFGNLAQQASTPSTSPFSAGNSSFSSWR